MGGTAEAGAAPETTGVGEAQDSTRFLGDPDSVLSWAPARVHEWLYANLRPIAARHMRTRRAGHLLQTTALLHEAMLKLLDIDLGRIRNRGHLLAVGSRALRHVLIDHWRKHKRRDELTVPLTFSADDASREFGIELVVRREKYLRDDIEALHEALKRLSKINPARGAMAELKMCGYKDAEIVELDHPALIGASLRSIQRYWKDAKAWLRRRLEN